jgi:hypothetical protein
MDCLLEKASSEDKNVWDKMESSSLLTISDLANLSPFMEGTFTFTIVMGIPESSLKSWDSLKDLPNHIKMTNGPQRLTISGCLKKTQS